MSGKQNHHFDKIIKENLERIFIPLSEKFFHFKILKERPLPEKLQTTIEREPDFLRIITDQLGAEFILHIEFQTHDEKDMAFRMAEYRAILQRKFKLNVRQFVVFLGARISKMQNRLPGNMVIDGFEIANIQSIKSMELIRSEIPEEIILAILGDFEEEDPDRIIKLILHQLKKYSKDEILLQKYITQLNVLSKLRKLEEKVTEEVNVMPIIYDYTEDYMWNRGIKEGIEQGMEQGIDKGVEKEKTPHDPGHAGGWFPIHSKDCRYCRRNLRIYPQSSTGFTKRYPIKKPRYWREPGRRDGIKKAGDKRLCIIGGDGSCLA